MNKRPRSEDVESGTPQNNQADVARKGLVSLNRLDYVLQPDLSVVTSRTTKRHFFQQTDYTPGTRAIAILNSGAEYIDPQNSYLQFTIQAERKEDEVKLSRDVYLGSGSALNFIKRAILTTRSGDELERVDEIGQLGTVLDHYMQSDQWLKTHGKIMGYQNIANVQDYGFRFAFTANQKDSNIHTFILPLGCLFGLFRSFDRLLPSMLCSGLRFEIEWETSLNTFITDETKANTSNLTLTYKLTQPEIVLDSYTLTDSIQRVLNEESAIRGLELVYTSFYYHSAQPKTSSSNLTSMNIEVRKAVSRALGVLHKIRPQAKIADFPHVDYYRSKPFGNQSYQLRLGSLYFPHQPIIPKGAATPGLLTYGSLYELYWHTMHGFGKIKTPSAPTSVIPYDGQSPNTADTVVVSRIGAYSYEEGIAAVYTDLERSTTQRLTGIPVNNSRVAEIQIQDTFPDTSTSNDKIGGWTVDVWLHYVRLARVFLQNVEIEE